MQRSMARMPWRHQIAVLESWTAPSSGFGTQPKHCPRLDRDVLALHFDRHLRERVGKAISTKRLLVKYKYPPDQQPGAIKLVMEQRESMARVS